MVAVGVVSGMVLECMCNTIEVGIQCKLIRGGGGDKAGLAYYASRKTRRSVLGPVSVMAGAGVGPVCVATGQLQTVRQAFRCVVCDLPTRGHDSSNSLQSTAVRLHRVAV